MKQQFFQFSDGRQLSWYETGDGAPLVLLHGWSISAAAFAEIVDLLGGHFRLLVPDLPGHGDSSPARENSLEGVSTDIATWLQKVCSGPVRLAGWSLGGMLAMHIASAKMLPLASLTLVGTTPRFTLSDDWLFGLAASQVQVLKRNLKRRFEPTLGDFFALTLAGESFSAERLRTIRYFAVSNSTLPDQTVAMELLDLLADQDQRDTLADIECPVHILHGTADRVSPVDAGRYIYDHICRGTLSLFEGVGHAPFWSRPRLFCDKIIEFENGSR